MEKEAVGDHGNAAHQIDALGSVARSPAALPASLLSGYRAAVDDLVQEVSGHAPGSDPASVEEIVSRRLQEPEFGGVLSRLGEGADYQAAGIIGEIRGYQPNAHASAVNLATYVRILLLSQIDLAWWGGSATFDSDADVLGSAELVDLAALRSSGRLEFQYRAQPAGLPGRALDWARHKALPDLRPRVSGLRFTCSRPVVVAVVNQIALDFAAAGPPRSPRIWVTSMVRSVEHQRRLRSLGYAAVLPSAHCAGYACDLESSWFRQFDPDNRLSRLLLERQEAGQLNVIDEGRAWHLCVNPSACDELQSLYDSQLRAR